MQRATTVGLHDLRDSFETTSMEDIRRAVSIHSSKVTKEEVEASRKVGDRATEDPDDRKYRGVTRTSRRVQWV